MKYFLFFILFISNLSFAADTSEAFIITIDENRIKVVSPKTKKDIVGIIIKNNTFDDIRSEIVSDKKVIKRFVLKSQDSESVQVDYTKVKTLFYVSIAPPFQAVELKFSQRPYEIPEKE